MNIPRMILEHGPDAITEIEARIVAHTQALRTAQVELALHRELLDVVTRAGTCAPFGERPG